MLKHDQIAVPYKANHPTQKEHCEWITFNTDAFKSKQYPTCKCGNKYVPIVYRKNLCPRCYAYRNRYK